MLFAAAVIGFGATSCSDFLEEDNKTGETADLAYNTVSGIDGLIQSAYTYTHGWLPTHTVGGVRSHHSDSQRWVATFSTLAMTTNRSPC